MAAPIGPPGGARELRSTIVVQRQQQTGAELGGLQGGWVTIIPSRAASLKPMQVRRGDAEQVIAARLQGTALWDCWVRFDSLTRTIKASDQVCDKATLMPDGSYGATFRVRFAEDMDQRRQWMFLQVEAGVAQGAG